MSSLIRLARVDDRTQLGAALLLLVSFPCLLLAALLPSLWFFAGACAVSYLADWWLHQHEVWLIKVLGKVRAGVTIRFLVRELLVVLLLARMGFSGTTTFYAALGGFLLFYGIQLPHGAVLTLVRKRRALPVVTRNIDLSGLRISNAPSPLLVNRASEKMLHLDLVATAGLLTTAATNRGEFGTAGCAIMLVLGVLYTAAVLPFLLRSRRPPGPDAVLAHINKWLHEYQPTVALYFSGARTSAYQVNMWLEPLAALTADTHSGRPLVIMRERVLVPQLAATRVPLLCVPSAVHLMNLDLSSLRVALYPANVGKNIHLLREPGVKHVFIGHGDSDKIASVNPFSKVYDEVWTAGRAGRDRYALADVGVRDEDIVEVGRPQLSSIQAWTGELAGEMPTVLYAPTWEGWTDDPGNTSLILAGANIIGQLLKAEPPVRVIYKPHPFTGSRSPRALAAHKRIIAMLEAASAARSTEPRWAEQGRQDAAAHRAASAELAEAEAKLGEFEKGLCPTADEAEQSRDGVLDPAREAAGEALQERWNDAYWRSFGWWEHQVVQGTRPTLYDCFNQADLMISDISSVVSDFIASGKPYAIADTANLGEEQFKLQNTAARAAFVLTTDAAGVPELLAPLYPGGPSDPLAKARMELKEYLLGPDKPDAQTRFNNAVRTLAAKADARLARLAVDVDGDGDGARDGDGDSDTAVPGQRLEDSQVTR